MIRFSQLADICSGKILRLSGDRPVQMLITDSRKAFGGESVVFFAIRGLNHDGHNFIHAIYDLGVRQFVVEYDHPSLKNLSDVNVFVATSAVNTLQELAAYHRQQFQIPVLAITGSNGKTIVKEWLYQLLSSDYHCVKNPGSYNSQIGVPLSVWQMDQHHQLAFFEAGISKPGEMRRLQKVISPTVGVFTNIGPAHNEGFSSIEEKLSEKFELFSNVEKLIYCKDHIPVDAIVRKRQIPSLSWGMDPGADIVISQNEDDFTISHKNDSIIVKLPFHGQASIENCFHCIAVMLHLGYQLKTIAERLKLIQPVSMRLEMKDGINDCQIVDDTYNNDLGGLQMSLQFLANQSHRSKKRVILSDVLEAGLQDRELVSHIARLVKDNQVSSFIGIGQVLSSHRELFDGEASFFPTTEAFLKGFDFSSLQSEVILVKGARIFKFEKIISRLQRKLHGTIMEIDLGAIAHNLNYFRSLLKPGTNIMVMVKAFAYGSGSIQIANLLQYHKVAYLGVAYADEGVDLRKNNIRLPIMVMNPSEETFDTLLEFNLEPELYNFRILDSFIRFLAGRMASVHIKFDTGMHRLGFEEKDIDKLIALLGAHRNLHVASIFSHLAGADEAAHDRYSIEQASKFEELASKLSRHLGYKPLFHLLNSPGILRLPRFQFDMVRLGIGLYGINPTDEHFPALKPAAALKTIVSQIRHLTKGQTIGYGRRGVADADKTIATIAIGYADGYSRAFSRGVGEVLINGKKAPVIGNVCMDMTMIDITGIPASEGDEVIIFGDSLPIHELARKINTIPYEILTNTSERVKRVFVAESI